MLMRLAPETTLVLVFACPLAACADEPQAPIYTCMDAEVHEYVQTQRPDYPLVWQTEHLDIYAKDNLTVCAGTAAELERHVVFVADMLGIEPRQHIPLYLSADWPEEACKRSFVGGCSTRDGVTFSSPTATYHELVHAVACQLRMVQVPALSEGLAESFDPRLNYITGEERDLRAAIEADSTEFGGELYSVAVHFVRWLIETRGGESFARLYHVAPAGYSYSSKFDGDDIIAAIETVYETDFEDLEREFWQTAPGYAWAPYRMCADVPHVDRDANGEWRYSSIIDCDSEDTYGPYERLDSAARPVYNFALLMHQSFTIEVPEDGWYALEYEGADEINLERCSTETADTEDEARKLFDTAVAIGPWNNDVKLVAGTWRLDVVRYDMSPAPVHVAVRETAEGEG